MYGSLLDWYLVRSVAMAVFIISSTPDCIVRGHKELGRSLVRLSQTDLLALHLHNPIHRSPSTIQDTITTIIGGLAIAIYIMD